MNEIYIIIILVIIIIASFVVHWNHLHLHCDLRDGTSHWRFFRFNDRRNGRDHQQMIWIEYWAVLLFYTLGETET